VLTQLSTAGGRNVLRAGVRLAAQHPSLILWYLQNRVRTGLSVPLEQKLGGGRAKGPRFVTLKPTLRCNLRCEFCRFVSNGDVFGKADWLPIEAWLDIIDQVAPYRPYLCLTGGEPTLYPELAKLIAHAKARGLFTVLTTNGTTLGVEKRVERKEERVSRADELLAAPPDLVILSVDGPEEMHDQVRMVDGAFSRALAGAKALCKAKERVKSKTPHLILNAALTGRTYAGALQMIEVAKRFGAEALNFQHFWFMTRSMIEAHNTRWGDCFPLDFDRVGGTATSGVDTRALAETVHRLRTEDHGLPITIYPDLKPEEIDLYYREPEAFTRTKTPDCAWISTDILPNGDVSPCFELVCGNARTQPFADIWNSDSFRAHRQRLAQHGPYPVCARCCAYFRQD
jgi:MoaA/NifB/PqqE/SkfB family radical SAM enzyme